MSRHEFVCCAGRDIRRFAAWVRAHPAALTRLALRAIPWALPDLRCPGVPLGLEHRLDPPAPAVPAPSGGWQHPRQPEVQEGRPRQQLLEHACLVGARRRAGLQAVADRVLLASPGLALGSARGPHEPPGGKGRHILERPGASVHRTAESASAKSGSGQRPQAAPFRACSVGGRTRPVPAACGRTLREPLSVDRTGALSWHDSAWALVVAGVGFEPT